MKNRLNWLLVIMIYLSVNGQVFAKAVHVCTEMAYTASVLSSANTTINIHEHHQPIEPRKDNHQIQDKQIHHCCKITVLQISSLSFQ